MKTIKELREKDANKLAERLNPNPAPEEIEKARHTMRLFYIFASAYYKNFIMQQESKNPAAKAAANERSNKTYKSAAEALKTYGLKIDLPGLYPVIDDENGHNFTFGFWYR